MEGGDEPADGERGQVGDDEAIDDRASEPTADARVVPVDATTSRWEINWIGAASLLVVAVVVLIAWSWLDGGGSGDDTERSDATPPTTVAVTPSTTSTATTTTLPATTTTSATTTTMPEPRVIVSGDVKPCRFGDRCLVASFRIEGFDEHPGRYVCIYPNSQSDFGFNDDDVDDACFTGDVTDTITIEVAGVRSGTISEDDLDGTG